MLKFPFSLEFCQYYWNIFRINTKISGIMMKHVYYDHPWSSLSSVSSRIGSITQAPAAAAAAPTCTVAVVVDTVGSSSSGGATTVSSGGEERPAVGHNPGSSLVAARTELVI